jgi:hypothetical protein
MSDKIQKDFNLGGSVDKALSGESELRVNAVLSEAYSLTVKNFISFLPAVVTFIAVSFIAIVIALNALGYDIESISSSLTQSEGLSYEMIQAFFIAIFSAEVICSPLFAGISLMGMSQAAGLKTKFSYLLKGFQFTIPVILVTLLNLIIQAISSELLGPVSLYFSLAFSHSVLLVCEKRLPLHRALLVSMMATNKKLFPLFILFTISTILIAFVFISSGIALIFILPFYMHLKGVIYRNLFGIRLTLVSPQNQDSKPQVFDA